MRHSYLPHTSILVPDATGRWLPQPAHPGYETEPGLIVYRFGADLFYANDQRFADEVNALVEHAPHQVTCIVVDAGAITDLDYSAARTVRQLIEDLKRRRVRIIFARVREYLRSDMDRHRLSDAVGPANIFATLHEGLAAARRPAPRLESEDG